LASTVGLPAPSVVFSWWHHLVCFSLPEVGKLLQIALACCIKNLLEWNITHPADANAVGWERTLQLVMNYILYTLSTTYRKPTGLVYVMPKMHGAGAGRHLRILGLNIYQNGDNASSYGSGSSGVAVSGANTTYAAGRLGVLGLVEVVECIALS